MHWKICLVVAAVVLVFSSIGSSSGILDFTIGFQDGSTVRLGINIAVPGGAFRQEKQGGNLVWVNNLYEVRLTPRFQKGIHYVHLHMESLTRASLVVSGLSWQAWVPSAAIAGVWTPSGELDNDTLISTDGATPFVTYSAANYGIPYIAAANASGDNSLAIGLLRQDLPVEIRAIPVTGGFTELTLNAALSVNAHSLDHDFFVSSDKSYTWYSVAETYAEWVDTETKYSPFPISSRAYEPVYDTWYWSRDHVDHRLYMRTAEAASAAGLRTFLADSGWDAPAGEYDKWLLGRTGDYTPPPEKFRDLSHTLNVLRSKFHLQVQLWLQPFAVGRASIRYAQTRGMHIQLVKTAESWKLSPFSLPAKDSNNLEDVNLCPRVSATHQYLKALFTEVSRAYRPEAYWLDFIDGMPAYCVAPHQHSFTSFGEGLRQALDSRHDSEPRAESRDSVPVAIRQFEQQVFCERVAAV
jgi:hypothetical protein